MSQDASKAMEAALAKVMARLGAAVPKKKLPPADSFESVPRRPVPTAQVPKKPLPPKK